MRQAGVYIIIGAIAILCWDVRNIASISCHSGIERALNKCDFNYRNCGDLTWIPLSLSCRVSCTFSQIQLPKKGITEFICINYHFGKALRKIMALWDLLLSHTWLIKNMEHNGKNSLIRCSPHADGSGITLLVRVILYGFCAPCIKANAKKIMRNYSCVWLCH